nr:hypothetical protein [Tanacetum cinerariifolium]
MGNWEYLKQTDARLNFSVNKARDHVECRNNVLALYLSYEAWIPELYIVLLSGVRLVGILPDNLSVDVSGTSVVMSPQYHVISCLGDCMILKLFRSFTCCVCRRWPFCGRDPRLFSRAVLPSGAFCPSVVYSFYLPFSLHHTSSGCQSASDVVVSKFDMHVYPFVMTFDEVKKLIAEYAIPLDLHSCVPPSGLTMNRLPVDKIVTTEIQTPKIMVASEEPWFIYIRN